MSSFNEDFKDIVDVGQKEVNCFGGEGPVEDFETIKNYGGFYRGKYLCYIKFVSKVNPVNKNFCLALEAKANSSRFRAKTANQSKWFLVFRDVENKYDDLQILDREYANLVFGFDVDKFFETDYFKSCVEIFKKTISKAIPQATELIQGQKATAESIQASNCLRAIQRGLDDLDKPPVFEDGRRTYTTHEEDPNKKYGAFNKDTLETVLRNQAAREEKFKERQALKGNGTRNNY